MNILKIERVIEKTTLGRSSIYAFVKAGKFPPPVKMGPRHNGWVESEIDAWVKSQVEKGNAPEPIPDTPFIPPATCRQDERDPHWEPAKPRGHSRKVASKVLAFEMTLRDYLAAMAMRHFTFHVDDAGDARRCYEVADAMLAAAGAA